jgi:hypothetical protein
MHANFQTTHHQFLSYIVSLSEQEYGFAHNEKWTAGQQLHHINLCLQPIAQAIASKEFIAQKFGTIERPIWEYDTVIGNYTNALAQGGKAPDRFVPQQQQTPPDKTILAAELNQLLQTIQQHLETYTDTELDTLVLPHPLLGKLTIREMMHLMAYHATHHHQQTKQNLQSFTQ